MYKVDEKTESIIGIPKHYQVSISNVMDLHIFQNNLDPQALQWESFRKKPFYPN